MYAVCERQLYARYCTGNYYSVILSNIQLILPEIFSFFFSLLFAFLSWPPKPPKYFSVGIFEYILASMPNVYLNV